MKTFLILFILIAGEATYEALAHRGKKFIGKLIELPVRGLELVILAMLLSGQHPAWMPQLNFWAVIGAYISLRIAIFRSIWNFIAHPDHPVISPNKGAFSKRLTLLQRYLYIGSTGPYDDFLYWVCYQSPIKAPPAIFLPVWEIWWFLLMIGYLNGNIIA